MATHDYIISNASGAAVRADLNNALAAIVSNNSNASSPSTTYAYQWWADTTTGQLKLRNSANSAWIVLMELDGTMLMEDGTVSAPGLAFASDLNTGFYRSAADKINFATGGIERLEIGSAEVVVNDASYDADFRVESNGQTHMLFVDGGNDRVGIGTSAPGDTFEVKAGFPVIAMVDSDTTNDKFRIVHNGGSTQLQVDPNNVSSSSHLLVSVDGSEAARIDSSGNLGLGLTSPTSKLHVSGVSGTTFTLDSPNAYSSTASILMSQGRSEIKTTIDSGGGNPGGTLLFRTRNTSGSLVDAVTVTNLQRVGIGTTSPSESLEVAGNGLKISGQTSGVTDEGITFDWDSSSNNGRIFSESAGSSNLLFYTTSSGSRGERLRIDNSGRLLVGTSSSTAFNGVPASIQVQGDADATTRMSIRRIANDSSAGVFVFGKSRSSGHAVLQNNDQIGKFEFYGADGSDTNQRAAIIAVEVDGTPGANDMPGRLVFSTCADGASSPTERMRINSDGTINCFSASAPMVWGRNETSGSVTALAFYNTATSTTSLGSGGVFRVMCDGDVENANNTYTSISDIKLKENVVNAASQWDDIKALQVRNYNFKESTGLSTHTQIGLVAQEVETVSPGLVKDRFDLDSSGNDTKTVTKSVNYSVLYMKAVKALQEAMTRIETLETEVAALKAG